MAIAILLVGGQGVVLRVAGPHSCPEGIPIIGPTCEVEQGVAPHDVPRIDEGDAVDRVALDAEEGISWVDVGVDEAGVRDGEALVVERRRVDRVHLGA